MDCFQPATQVKSFIVCCNSKLLSLDTLYQIFYCTNLYQGRHDPNHTLIQLTEVVHVSSHCPWYSTILVLKFGSQVCQNYLDMQNVDVI